MNTTDITSYRARLDDLRVVTLTDGEVWSARDLMELAGYTAWQDFSNAINRAIASVNASGLDASEHFRGAPKSSPMPNGGFRQIEDVELTRYGCYILFQNADARKPEIAAAQQYFAVQTRQQEIAPVAELSEDEIVQRAFQIMSSRVAALETKITEDAPKVAYVDEFLERGDVLLFTLAANELGIPVGQLRDRLMSAGWIYRKFIGARWSKSKGAMVDEHEYYAAAQHSDKFSSKEQLNAPRHHNGQVRTTLYIRPAALPAIKKRIMPNLVAVNS